MLDEVVMSLRGVGRNFCAVRALYDVNLDVRVGEIIALVGDNGAGKSTLMNIMCGAEAPDEGVSRITKNVIQRFREDAKTRRGEVGLVK